MYVSMLGNLRVPKEPELTPKERAFQRLSKAFEEEQLSSKPWTRTAALREAASLAETQGDWRQVAAYILTDLRLLGSQKQGFEQEFFTLCELTILGEFVDGEGGMFATWQRMAENAIHPKMDNRQLFRVTMMVFDALEHLVVRTRNTGGNYMVWVGRLEKFIAAVINTCGGPANIGRQLSDKIREFRRVNPDGFTRRRPEACLPRD